MLNSLVGLEIVDIKRTFSSSKDFVVKEEKDLSEMLQRYRGIITIELSNGIEIDISQTRGRYVELREALVNGMKTKRNPDIINGLPKGVILMKKEMFTISARKMKESDCQGLIGAKIKDAYLLKMRIEHLRKIIPTGYNALRVNGFGFELDQGEVLIHHGYRKGMPAAIEMDLGSRLIRDEVFDRSTAYFEYGKTYKITGAPDLWTAPPEQFDEVLVNSRKEVLLDTIIDVSNPHRSIVSSEKLSRLLRKYPEIDLNRQTLFFREVKQKIQKGKFGIIDLKFALDTQLDFKILAPIDYVGELRENITFIDSILGVFEGQDISLDKNRIS